MVAALLLASLASTAAAEAQPRPKIAISLEVRSEGRADRDATATQLLAGVRTGLQALDDVEVLESSDGARRTIWIVGGATPGQYAASVIVTERYDRETLMVLGIEDDDMAFRMMALRIVIDHQIFTGRSPQELAKRIVVAVNTGALARLRALPPKPE
jgi:hypothetical protein